MDLEAFRWLLTDQGQTLLASATALAETAATDPLYAQAALRQRGTPEHAAAALTQATLRQRAEAKFGDAAASMYFTPEGLEQATRLPVATHRAARVGLLRADASVVDLGCGVGGDLVAFARAGLTAAGVDLDPLRVEVARANLASLGLDGAVAVADATTVELGGFDVAYADPARRTARGRSFDVADLQPPWAFVERLLGRDSCVKAAPGLPHALVPDGVEAEWVSDRGEVKEACLWSGLLATTARRATVLGADGLASLTDAEDPGGDVAPVARFLYEPDGAVIRAGLVTAVAAIVGGGLVDEHLAYVTSERQESTPFARGYEVLEELPYREKQLRAALRERRIGTLTIKKRGVEVVPEQLRTRLALVGDQEATVVLTRAAGRGVALLVRPL